MEDQDDSDMPGVPLDVFIRESLNQFADSLKEEIQKELKDTMAEVRVAIRTKLEGELEEMMQKSKFGVRLDAAEQAVKGVKQDIAQKVLKIDDNVFKELKQSVAALEKEFDGLKSGEGQIGKNKLWIDWLASELKKQGQEVSENASKIKRLEPLLSKDDPEYDDAIEALRAKVAKLEGRIAALGGGADKGLKQQVNLLESRLGELRKDCGSLRKDTDEHDESIKRLQNCHQQLSDQLESLKTADQQLSSRVDIQEIGISGIRSQVSDTNNELDKTRQALDDLHKTCKRDMMIKLDIQTKLQAFHGDIQAVVKRVGDLEKEMPELDTNVKAVSKLRSDIADLKGSVDLIPAMKEKVDKVDGDLQALDSETKKNSKKFGMLRTGFTHAVAEANNDMKTSNKIHMPTVQSLPQIPTMRR